MNTSGGLLEAAKLTITIPDVLAAYHIGVAGRGMRRRMPCPIHRGRNPECFSFNDERFRCFNCDAHGDVVDLEHQLGGGDFRAALERLRARHQLAPARINVAEARRLQERARRVQAWHRRRSSEWTSALARAEQAVREWQCDPAEADCVFWFELERRCRQRDIVEAMVETFTALRTLTERARAYATEQRGVVILPEEVL